MRLVCLIALFIAGPLSAKDETVAGYVPRDSVWRLVSLYEEQITQVITLEFAKRKTLSGQAPCNRYAAKITAPLPWFEIDGIKATKRACPLLALEARYFQMLQSASFAEISGETLILSDQDKPVAIFTLANQRD